MAAAVNALVGALALFLGRQLFWIFVAAAGFLIGFNLASEFLPDAAPILIILIGVVVGVLGAVLAVFAQRLAVAVAGFITGGYLLLYMSQLLGMKAEGTIGTILFIVGGIVGAIVLSVLLDPALIVLSAALGATLLTQAAEQSLNLSSPANALVFVVLLVIGIVVQWAAWQRRELPEEPVA